MLLTTSWDFSCLNCCSWALRTYCMFSITYCFLKLCRISSSVSTLLTIEVYLFRKFIRSSSSSASRSISPKLIGDSLLICSWMMFRVARGSLLTLFSWSIWLNISDSLWLSSNSMWGYEASSSSTVCMVITFSFEDFWSAYSVWLLLVGTYDFTVVWRLMYFRSNSSSWIYFIRTVSLFSVFCESCWLSGGSSLLSASDLSSFFIQDGILCL